MNMFLNYLRESRGQRVKAMTIIVSFLLCAVIYLLKTKRGKWILSLLILASFLCFTVLFGGPILIRVGCTTDGPMGGFIALSDGFANKVNDARDTPVLGDFVCRPYLWLTSYIAYGEKPLYQQREERRRALGRI